MSQNQYTTKGRGVLAFLIMLIGGLLMVVLVVSFNKSVKEKESQVKKEVRQIKANKTQKKTTKSKPKPKRSQPKRSQPKAPLPNMNSILGGVAMNIPEFTTDYIAGDSSKLLKDIAEDAIMNENTVDVKPRVLSRPPLEYPSEAAKNGLKGYVVINILIAKDGSVELAKVLEAQPVGVFDNAALNAVRAWRFSPAQYKAKPVKMWAKQKIRFQ